MSTRRFVLAGRVRISVSHFIMLQNGNVRKWRIDYARTGYTVRIDSMLEKIESGFHGSVIGESLREAIGKLRFELASELNPEFTKVHRRMK